MDHPHGGGRGKSKGNRIPVSPWGQPVCIEPSHLSKSAAVDRWNRPNPATRRAGRTTTTDLWSRPVSATWAGGETGRAAHERCQDLVCTYEHLCRTDECTMEHAIRFQGRKMKPFQNMPRPIFSALSKTPSPFSGCSSFPNASGNDVTLKDGSLSLTAVYRNDGSWKRVDVLETLSQKKRDRREGKGAVSLCNLQFLASPGGLLWACL